MSTIPMNSPHRDPIDKVPPAAKYLMVLGLGVSIGLLILFLADREARWIVIAMAALAGLLIIIVMPSKQKLLTTIFILSLQVDIYLRFLYGRAGSNEGLAIPLVVFGGGGVLVWYAIAGRLRTFRWAGSMGIPILALFATGVLSIVTSSERFVGLTSLLYSIELYFLYWLAFNLGRSQEDFERIIKLLLIMLGTQATIYFVQSALGITFNFMGETIQGGERPDAKAFCRGNVGRIVNVR